MDVKVNFKEGSLVMVYAPSQTELELLKLIADKGYIEIRSSRIDEPEEQSKLTMCIALSNAGLLYSDMQCWNDTYEITARGKDFIGSILSKE